MGLFERLSGARSSGSGRTAGSTVRSSEPPVPRFADIPNASRVNARRFAERAAARGTGPDFRVLDAGAGSAPYRDLFAHVHYEAADVAATPGKDYSHIDHLCDVVDIPVGDGTYDLVWCSQVLEHVREPERALREFHRILRPGGEVWLTAPSTTRSTSSPGTSSATPGSRGSTSPT